jgi:tRNA/tmRNA/rRNA uracil-C5-methylase (TrmA/RlmC/RlmD family)
MRLPARQLRTPAGDQMATGARRASTNRQAQGYSCASDHPFADIERCPISNDQVNRALAELRAQPQVLDGHYTLRASTNARGFSQTNDAVADALRNLIVDLVPPNQELLIDAYCGTGFFAKSLVDKFERVIGIDWDRFAIQAAKETATAKETYIAGNVEDVEAAVSAAFSADVQPQALGTSALTTIIVDPPATGLSVGVRKAIIDLSPRTLIYVSCNPPTLARDLRELPEKFTIDSVTPLDMFPQTAEIEAVAHLHTAFSP